jgi:hypothetical protein
MVDALDVLTRLCQGDEAAFSFSMNSVADFFRRGGDLTALVPVLTHSDPRVVECGVWIASEVVDTGYGREIFEQIWPLLSHPSPQVRFWAIASVAYLVTPEEGAVVDQLFMRVVDPNPGVRRQALRYVCLVPDSTVESLRDTTSWPSVQVLLTTARKDEIRSALRSPVLFEQRMAIAAAVRNFAGDEGFIDELRQSIDDEVAEIFPALPRNRSYS